MVVVVLGLMLLVSVAGLLRGQARMERHASVAAGWREVTGRVVGSAASSPGPDAVWLPVVEYRMPDGSTRRFTGDHPLDARGRQPSPGDEVVVHVHREDPARARLTRRQSLARTTHGALFGMSLMLVACVSGAGLVVVLGWMLA